MVTSRRLIERDPPRQSKTWLAAVDDAGLRLELGRGAVELHRALGLPPGRRGQCVGS